MKNSSDIFSILIEELFIFSFIISVFCILSITNLTAKTLVLLFFKDNLKDLRRWPFRNRNFYFQCIAVISIITISQVPKFIRNQKVLVFRLKFETGK